MIRAAALAPLLAFASASDLQFAAEFSSNALSSDRLSDPYAFVPLARYVETFEAMAHKLSAPDLGLRVGMHIRPADLGPMGVLFSMSPSLRAGFARLSSHVRTLQGGTQSSLFEVGGDLVWTYRIADMSIWPRRQDAEYTLAAVCQLARSSFSARWAPLEVHLEHAAGIDPQLLQRVFRAPVLFGQSANRLIIEGDAADRIYRSEDPGLARILERHIADLTQAAPLSGGLVEEVHQMIALFLGQRPITLSVIAAELRMSPRSLQRHLAEQGTSLRALLRDHRQELAVLKLRSGGLQVSQVAAALGYADGTVFWRAYRNWTGDQPSKARLADE